MKKLLAASLLAAAFLLPVQAFAGDTYETIDKDTIEILPSFTLDGLGDGNPSVYTSLGVVYGVFDGLNIGATIGFGSDEGMAGGSADLGINILWTPLDTDHFDLDVMADFEFNTADGYTITPGIELNYDLNPDLSLWGLYLRFGLPIHGEFTPGHIVEDEDNVQATSDLDISLTLGTYFTIADIHQILLEGGFEVNNLAQKLGDTGISSPFVSVGYNVYITDTFEFTTELAFNIPYGEDDFSATFTVGGIFDILTKDEAESDAEDASEDANDASEDANASEDASEGENE